MNSADVLFYWNIVSESWEEEVASTMLRMIVNLWITIRKFSAASGWIEIHKQASSKQLQKSKGVRKRLNIT